MPRKRSYSADKRYPFGDKVSLFDGSLQFEQTDLQLKGNNELPVALTRGVSPGKHDASAARNFPLGDWAWKLPRIGGAFATSTGWLGYDGSTARCSKYWRPKDEHILVGKALHDVFFSDFWHGTYIDVPGQSSQEVTSRESAYASMPQNGGDYPLVTKGQWQIGCLSSLKNGAGEGFYALSPTGVRYDFDWMVVRTTDSLRISNKALARQDIHLYASKVTDRFGNWVKYAYDASNPGLLQRIESSDSRLITVINSGGRAQSATDGTRTVSYAYISAADLATLSSVTLPDGRQWQFNIASMHPPSLLVPFPPTDACDDGSTLPNGPSTFAGSIIHPSGATGVFTTQYVVLNKIDVQSFCNISDGVARLDVLPAYVNVALGTKQISGPGLPTMQWTFTFTDEADSSEAFTNFHNYRAVTVTGPEGFVNRHLYGNTWHVNEGLLLADQIGWNGVTALRTTSQTYHPIAFQTNPVEFGSSMVEGQGDWFSARLAPVSRVSTIQQGQIFSYMVNQFDGTWRPTQITRTGPGGSRSETTAYADNLALWVIGQVQSVTSGADVMQSNGFNSMAQPNSYSSFGVLKYARSYNTDGTLASEADPLGHTTYLGNYMRGLPQSVSYPTGATESAVVNNLGLFASYTNAAGYTTGYGYDAMGRLATITPPAGWAGTTVTFQPVSMAEYGLAANHWRLSVSQGNARTISYFDAMWRPVMTRTFDAATEASTRKVVVKAYDSRGNVTFESYPQRDVSTVAVTGPGKRTTYDAMSRLTQSDADSELGVLTSTTEYLGGFQTRNTNPRGQPTLQTLWALDKPQDASISTIAAPEGVNVSIVRDVFGKPTRISRGGVTRSYVYDGAQRLCKTLEPESGATIQDYDAAGNLAWRAPGQALPSPTSCDTANVLAAGKMIYGYTALNQLSSVSYGDASPGISRSYTPDGLLQIITSNASTWIYGYNTLRQIATESLAYAGQNYNLAWAYNASGGLISLTYPNGSTVTYSPNALGEPTNVSGYASAIAYHPNGEVASYTLASGINHTLTQNTRGLPLVNRDAGVLQDQYSFDANGNVTAIADQQENIFNRAMGYDGLDRLTSANAPGVWGNASYGYDAADNLRAAVVGSRVSSLVYDASNRLTSVITNGSSTNYGYDPRGNLSSKGLQTFSFDIGNRLSASSLGGNYTYDGHGRRIRVQSSDGSTRMQVYSQGGQMLWATSTGGPRPASSTAYVYLGGKQIAETSNGVTQYVHTDALGSPVAHTNAAGSLMNRTRFEAYGYPAQGTKPGPNTSLIGFTGHVQDAETDLVYMQQRYYDPIVGRFLSVDPVVTDANTGKGFGLYTYVDNNPYAKVDPDGRAGELFWSASDKVTYMVKYTMTGVASPVSAAAINAQIAKDFSGTVNVGGKDVTINAVGVQVDKAGPGVNTLNVVKDTAGVTDSGRSETNAIGGSKVTIGASGKDAAGAQTVSHELGGHAGGAGDQYKGGVGANGKTLGADVPGPANVMKDLSGQPANKQTLGEIIKAPTNSNSCAKGVGAANGGC